MDKATSWIASCRDFVGFKTYPESMHPQRATRFQTCLAIAAAIIAALSAPSGVDAESSEEANYRTLKDARLNLLRAEDKLARDIQELKLDVNELCAKLKKKSDDLKKKQDALHQLQFAIRDCERQMAYQSRLF
jgi:septal ring factor EnvC (AmiA/AmiB activator)